MTLVKLYLTVNFAVPVKLLHDCTAVNSFSILQQFTVKTSEHNFVCTGRVLEHRTVRKLYRFAKTVSAWAKILYKPRYQTRRYVWLPTFSLGGNANVLYIVIFWKCQSLAACSSSPGNDRYRQPLTFWYKIECLTTFIKKKILKWSVFLAAFGPKVSLLCRFCTLEHFENTNLWRLVAPLPGVIDICAHWFLIRNWMLNNFYFKKFLK